MKTKAWLEILPTQSGGWTPYQVTFSSEKFAKSVSWLPSRVVRVELEWEPSRYKRFNKKGVRK